MVDQKNTRQLPVFPLNTVVFPGGHLPLRIFEPRYVDMVARCGREGIGFVVVAIQQGLEAGVPAHPYLVGTEVHIEDWNQEESGLLLLDCRGAIKVRLESTWLQDDGLRLADVTEISHDSPETVAEQHENLWQLLDQLQVQPSGEQQRTASWLSGRLTEALPLPLGVKQELLCEPEPNERLAMISRHLRSFYKA